jgi:conjugal transfer mating pair stabilization protein TraG
LRPNRVLSDGAALPESFEELRRRHDQDRSSPRLDPDIMSSGRGNSRQVSGFGRSTPKVEEVLQPSSIRSEIERKGLEIRQGSESSQGSFDANAQIVRSPDGTLTTKKSLLMQSGRQVATDTTESIDAAEGLAKDLLKRKK